MLCTFTNYTPTLAATDYANMISASLLTNICLHTLGEVVKPGTMEMEMEMETETEMEMEWKWNGNANSLAVP